MSVDRLIFLFGMACLATIITLFGFAMFQEACDVSGGWPCGVADDGFHDGEFNWRHGVFPW